MKRAFAIAALWLLPLAVFAAEWDLGPSRWEVTSAAAQVDEDTGLWVIDLQEMPASFWTVVNSTDGRDVRVTSSDADTQVPAFLLNFDHTAEEGWLFAKDGISASASDSVFIYAGDAGAAMPATGSTYGRDATLTAFIAAYLDGLTDWTGNGHDLTEVGNPGTVTGPVAGTTAYDFDGSDDTLTVDSGPIDPMETSTEFTIDCWIKLDATDNDMPWYAGSDADTQWFLRADTTNTKWRGNIKNPSDANHLVQGDPNSASTGVWRHVAITYDASDVAHLIVNGSEQDSQFLSAGLKTSGTGGFSIGSRDNTSNYLDGQVGLMFMSDVERSVNYLATINRMWETPGTVFTVGSEENDPGAGGTTPWWIILLSEE